MPIGARAAGLHLSAVGTVQDGVRFIPCRSAAAIAQPTPVRSNGRNARTNQIEVTPAFGDTGRDAYVGFLWRPVGAGQAASVVRGAVVTGFTGLTPNAAVYVHNSSTPAEMNLSHVLPTTGNVRTPIGVAVSTDTIIFD